MTDNAEMEKSDEQEEVAGDVDVSFAMMGGSLQGDLGDGQCREGGSRRAGGRRG